MPTIGVLSWLNETALSPYPLTKDIGINGLLIDANFLQFNNFVPILNSYTVDATTVTFNIIFDVGLIPITVSIASMSSPYKMYSNTRYLGSLVFGYNATSIVETQLNQTIVINTPFLAHLVRGIPSNCGVYSIDGFFGALTFNHDANIWYSVAGQDVTFNAVSLPATSDIAYLKTLNSVTPTENNVYIQETALLKVTGDGLGNIKVSLIGTSVTNLIDEQSGTLPTNPNPPS